MAGGSDQDHVRHGDERPPGWDALAGGRTERPAAAGINADGPFLVFFSGGCGAR